ncbi:HPr family phosphocarrier protein [Anaeromicrobium sediminis]|uniref:Phosphocarrier protein HPr n=1 Tax=Anaeromicrobium sediminis TaxID=1478221 RepID=A0A267MLX1_9FIRM|nr:HPr family phosphocarrier protein [Anaeromicrobium sediminis]PAB59803.1 phosphocarrier protein HPr [Anaeromicrobium sediminis]
MGKLVTILNETGMHARPASNFVKVANSFKSDINIEFNGKASNAKSIMNLLSLGLKKGDQINITANGEDAQAAVDALVDLVNSKFGEE